ncbi:MAG: hypothetical protein Q7R57_05580, partial [Dehalococcoidales bacterium]|nr:hypothetical protein [Dehalococcoidales bacterium]
MIACVMMKGTRASSRSWLRRMGIIIAVLFTGMLALPPAAPVRAFDAGNILFPNFPTTGASGTTFSFSVLISIPQFEYVPIGGITVYMFRADNRAAYQATCSGLPLGDFSRFYSEAETAGGRAAVYATPADKWSVVTGSGYGPGPTSIKYDVFWEIPMEWMAGPGQVEVRVATSNTTSYLQTASFSITMPAPIGGTYVPSQAMNGAGKFTQSFAASSADARAKVNINQGTTGLVRGQLHSEIATIRLLMPPPTSAETRIVDRTYTFGPEGTTFYLPVTVSIVYDPTEMPAG